MEIPLDWADHPFQYPGMLKITINNKKSSWFHAALAGFSKIYRDEGISAKKSCPGRQIRRDDLVAEVKDSVINLLAKINPADPKGRSYYQCLNGGSLEEMAIQDSAFSLEAMQAELEKGQPYDGIYHEFLSDALKKDIYILDSETKDVYLVSSQMSLCYKNRSSIVLLRSLDHYDLIGIRLPTASQYMSSLIDPEPIRPEEFSGPLGTHFPNTHQFIEAIRKRMQQKIDSQLGLSVDHTVLDQRILSLQDETFQSIIDSSN